MGVSRALRLAQERRMEKDVRMFITEVGCLRFPVRRSGSGTVKRYLHFLHFKICLYMTALVLSLLRHARRDVSPKATSRAPAALPCIRIDQPKVISDARIQTKVVRKIRRHWNALDDSARCVEVHLKIRISRVCRPEQVIAGILRYGCVRGVPAGFDDGNDRTVMHDEIAPYLLESVDEIRCWCCCVD